MSRATGRMSRSLFLVVALIVVQNYVAVLPAVCQVLTSEQQAEVDSLTRQIKANPSDYSLFAKRGFILDKAGAINLAEPDFKEAVRLDPHWAQGHYFLAAYEYNRGELRTSLAHLNAACDIAPSNLGYLKLRALVLGKLNEPNLAIADWSRVISSEPTYEPAYYFRAANRHRLGGATLEVQSDLKTALRLSPNDAEASMFYTAVQKELEQLPKAP